MVQYSSNWVSLWILIRRFYSRRVGYKDYERNDVKLRECPLWGKLTPFTT